MTTDHTDWLDATTIAGVPVHYPRLGSELSPSPRRTITPAFHAALTSAFMELAERHPKGRPIAIVTGGIRGDSNSGKRHRQGRAFDINSIHWRDFDLHTWEYEDHPRLQLAIEAILRKHIGTVLGYPYYLAREKPKGITRNHKGHWHVDNGTVVAFNHNSTSEVAFVQAVLTHVWKRPVALDGLWGEETAGAAVGTCWDRGTLDWMAFLNATIEEGLD